VAEQAKFRTWAETTDAIIFIIQGSLSSQVYVNPAAEPLLATKQKLLALRFLPTAQAQEVWADT